MSKSNPVHLWRFGCTRALIFTQKWLNRLGWHLQKKMATNNIFWDHYQKKNPVSGRAMVKGKMLHFVAFFVHFDKLIRPHPGPLWGEGGEVQGRFVLRTQILPNLFFEYLPKKISQIQYDTIWCKIENDAGSWTMGKNNFGRLFLNHWHVLTNN